MLKAPREDQRSQTGDFSMVSAVHDSRTTRSVGGALCVITLGAILFAALRPFHVPENEVYWDKDESSLRFGRTGTILSADSFNFTSDKSPSCSLEAWFEPALVWTRGTILSFYSPSNALPLSVYQDYTHLVVQLANPNHENGGKPPLIQIKDVFRKHQVFLTITSNGRDAAIYVDGQLVAKKDGFGLSAQNLSGQLLIANSPLRDNSWQGGLRGLAVYNTMLTASEVSKHYEDWTQRRRAPDTNNSRLVAVYTFRERAGRIIHDSGASGVDLYIPKKFLVVNQLLLEMPWSEVYSDRYYLEDCLLNIAGFIPLGLFATAYFRSFQYMKRPALAAIFAGGCISLLIEIVQAYLPTRFSGVTDIITNTMGTAIGARFYRVGVLRLQPLISGSQFVAKGTVEDSTP
jgi:VanZ family protein